LVSAPRETTGFGSEKVRPVSLACSKAPTSTQANVTVE